MPRRATEMFRSAVLLFCLLFSSQNGAGSTCVANLPQNEQELRQLVNESGAAPSLKYGDEARLFPNITFSCRGSVVGWSLIAPLHDNPPGRRPIMNVWSPQAKSDEAYEQLRENSTDLIPCLKEVISKERQLYLYENTTMEPLEFQPGDILGMVLRDTNKNNSIFTPYMLNKTWFVAYHRDAKNARPTENIRSFGVDNMMPLLFLHICSMDDADYESCLKDYERPPTMCIETSPDTRSGDEDEGGVSQTVLAVALGVSLIVALLVVSTLLGLTLVYIAVTKRRHRRNEKVTVTVTTDNTNIQSEAQPYAEPFPSRTHTPLPPPPTHPPPPPNGLSIEQPTYAVLDGPSPSPPPPYSLDLHSSRPPPQGSLQSPQYESIDGQERKAALLRQNATESNMDSAGGYSRAPETNNVTTANDFDHNQ